MKKAFLTLALAALTTSSAAHGALIINEVYGGGGASGSTYTRDFVELYNTDLTPVSLTGYSLQYASPTNSTATPFTNIIVTFGAGSLIGGSDYLSVATGTAGTSGATLGLTDVTFLNGTSSGASLGGTNGAVRLVDASGTVIDLVGYGTLTNAAIKAEGSPAPASTTTTSLSRTNFADTGSNSTDFTSGTPSPNRGVASIVVVPEPTTLAALAGVGLVAFRRRRA